jgi:hypothetical protein
MIKTSHWFADFPDDHLRIGISRGTPRNAKAGYRLFKKLAPGPWFNSVGPAEYVHLYNTEILSQLDPRVIAADLLAMAGGRIPVLLCYERPNGKDWCHRAMAAQWLAEATGSPVPELGFENLAQHMHPLWPEEMRPAASAGAIVAPQVDIASFIGKTAKIDGKIHEVTAIDETDPSKAVVSVGVSSYRTGTENLLRYFQ